MKPYYRLSLKKDSNTYFAIEANSVVERAQPFYLDNPPDNWAEIAVKDERNMRMFGFVRSYASESYSFVLEAQKILYYAWMKYGNGGIVKLYVERLVNLQYEFDFIADLALNTANCKKLAFEVKSLEAGISAKVKSREDIIYEIPVTTANGAEDIDIAGLQVLGAFKYHTGWPIRVQGTNTASFGTTASLFKVYCLWVDKTIVAVSNTPQNQPASTSDSSSNNFITGQDFENITGAGTYTNANNFLLRANVFLNDLKIKVSVPFSVHNKSGTDSTFRMVIRRINAAGVISGTFIATATSAIIPAGQIRNFTLSIDTTAAPITMLAGEKLILEAGMTTIAAQDINVAWEKDYVCEINFQHSTDTFRVKGISWYNIGKKLTELITDGDATYVSKLFSVPTPWASNWDLDPSMLYMLSGDSIRGIPNAKIKISLKDFQKASLVLATSGLGVEDDKIIMETVPTYLNATRKIADLGKVKDCKIRAASDFVYNVINIGYKPVVYDQVNGKDEPNTTHVYQLPNIMDKKECDMISPVRADGLGIFFTWVNYALAEDRDSSEDNTLFALQCIRPAGQPLRALYPQDMVSSPTVTGYIEPQRLMNVGLTPKHLLYRNGALIQSFFFSQDNDYIKFQTTDKNDSLVTKVTTSKTIIEKADVQLKELSQRMFYPVYYEIETEIPGNYSQQWKLQRNGYFTFEWNGKLYKGFPCLSVDKHAEPKIESYRLLAMTLDIIL